MLFKLVFSSNNILSYFFFFFLILTYTFLIPAVIAQIFNLIAKLIIPIGMPSKEAKVQIKIHPVTVKIELKMSSV